MTDPRDSIEERLIAAAYDGGNGEAVLSLEDAILIAARQSDDRLPSWQSIAAILHDMASADGCEPGCATWHEDEAKVMLNVVRAALASHPEEKA